MKILLADDHGLVREALKSYLERAESGTEVICVCSLGEAVEATKKILDLDLAILDLRMPGMDGFDGLDTFISEFPGVTTAIMSGLADEDDVKAAIAHGALGFFPKTLSGPALLNAIKLVMAGERFVPYDVSGLMHDAPVKPTQGTITDKARNVNLSKREMAVMVWLLKGYSNKEIARELDLQEVTIKLHMRSICRKLNVKNRTQAALFARETGLDVLVNQEVETASAA